MKVTAGLTSTARTRPLIDGRVPIEGAEVEFATMGVQELFNLQLREHPFDVCEFPLVTYLRSLEQPGRPYTAVPVFPSRHFRLSCVFVSDRSPIESPAELAGRRVGLPVFDMAAAVWLRGILHDLHGLDRHAPVYVTAGSEGPREGDEHPQVIPAGFCVERRTDIGLAQLLEQGEIDALYSARAPSTWPGPAVRRLFSDPRKVELAYHAHAGFFPAMHILAVKRTVAEAAPDLLQALVHAFDRAQAVARAQLFDSATLDSLLPWQLEELLESERLLGADLWANGFTANRRMLEQIIEYARADGLITSALRPEDLFEGPMSHLLLHT